MVFANNLYWHPCAGARGAAKSTSTSPCTSTTTPTSRAWPSTRLAVSQGAANSIFLTLGTGVGAAVSSSAGASMWAAIMSAPELGHMIVSVNGRNARQQGLLGDLTSATALIQRRRGRGQGPSRQPDRNQRGRRPVPDHRQDRARRGQGRVTLRRWRCSTVTWSNGHGDRRIINCFDPEIIAIGGGVRQGRSVAD